MKWVECIGVVLVLAVLLTGCKNRFETFEPYTTFDERMAAESGHTYKSDESYHTQFNTAARNTQNQKHAANIGALSL